MPERRPGRACSTPARSSRKASRTPASHIWRAAWMGHTSKTPSTNWPMPACTRSSSTSRSRRVQPRGRALAPDALRPPEAGRLTPFEYGGWMWRWLGDVDPRGDAVVRLFDRLIAEDTALDPTLVLFAARPGAFGDDVGDTSMDDPERTLLLPNLPDRVREELISRWAERRRAAVGVSPRGVDRMRRGWEHLLALVGRFHRAGGTVLAGTDCPNVAIVSGFSLHRELELLVRAGLSPMDALLAATSRPAARLDREDEFGTISPGLSADLLLLAADPLADIRNVRRIERVITRGRVYEPQRLVQAS